MEPTTEEPPRLPIIYSKHRSAYWQVLLGWQDFCIQVWRITTLGLAKSKWRPLSENPREALHAPIVHRERLRNELVIDFDNKTKSLNLARAIESQNFLKRQHGIDSNLWWTGGKGIHLHSFLPGCSNKALAGLFALAAREVRTKTDRGVMLAARHLIRAEWSWHEGGKGFKIPVREGLSPTTVPITKLSRAHCAELENEAPENVGTATRRRTWES